MTWRRFCGSCGAEEHATHYRAQCDRCGKAEGDNGELPKGWITMAGTSPGSPPGFMLCDTCTAGLSRYLLAD